MDGLGRGVPQQPRDFDTGGVRDLALWAALGSPALPAAPLGRPSPEGRGTEIIAALERVAERAPGGDTRSGLRRVAAYLGPAGRDLLVDVAAAAIAKGSGIG